MVKERKAMVVEINAITRTYLFRKVESISNPVPIQNGAGFFSSATLGHLPILLPFLYGQPSSPSLLE
ncbi:hypothetical protein COE25_17390 [Bacillus sp. AFS031507]|nr:hypothetical protein COE25_17390 [Bacillus sp. AFS031507]